ncbi:hypothetical protein LA345_12620 [Burkholderia vietnamiensis]|uniref:Uncharacterized protein n=1 Tax=Burkholderia vietnamiensis (strain G4 / LMG 22486) TaxID=269482 RepID=A4JFE4_BURVG|nr:hypothetical protein Bcep1808_1994 [Burkholderia vietnamiensis G4]MCB4344755.1 hypothetical protein [Burkholderia vietnamiensis]
MPSESNSPAFSQSSTAVARHDAPFDPAQAVRREIARDWGGRVELAYVDPRTGFCVRPPDGVAPDTPGHEQCWLYVGRPKSGNHLVAPTTPCETPEAAWDSLVENMAISKPGRLAAPPIRYFHDKRPTSSGCVVREERLEAREIEGGIQVLLVVSMERPGEPARDIAQNRIRDETGRAPKVFADIDHANAFMTKFRRDFLDAGADDREAALEAQRDDARLSR